MVKLQLRNYIENNILQRYDMFDDSHKRDHVEYVIKTSVELASIYNIDVNMTYTAAAYHDIGLSKGRENHEIHSYNEVLHDTNLGKFFSDEEIMQIAIACKEHRASTKVNPDCLSMLSKIIRDADRSSDIGMMIKRAYLYNKNASSVYESVRNHLVDKYGVNGYAVYHLKETLQTESLKEAKEILADENLFRIKYDEIVEKIR